MAKVVVEMSGDEAKLYKSYQRIIDQATKLDGAVKQNKRTHDDAFGDKATSQLVGYAGRLAGMLGILGSIKSAFDGIQARASQLAATQISNAPGIGPLGQLALADKDPKSRMRQLYLQSQGLYQQGVGQSVADAARLQFGITSAQMDQYLGQIGELQASNLLVDATGMTRSATALRASLGEKKTGTFPRIVSKMLGASAITPAYAESIGQAAALAAPQAARLGIGMDELLSGVAALATPAGSAEEAGTLLDAFMRQTEKEGLMKKRIQKQSSLRAYIETIAAAEAKGTSARTILGNRQEAIKGFGMLKENLPAFDQAMGLVREFDAKDAFTQGTQLYKEIPEMVAARGGKSRAAQSEIAEGGLGSWSNLADMVQRDWEAKIRTRYGGTTSRWGLFAGQMEGHLSTLDRWTQGDQGYVREWMVGATPETKKVIQDFMDAAAAMKDAAENMRDSTNRSRAAAGSQPE